MTSQSGQTPIIIYNFLIKVSSVLSDSFLESLGKLPYLYAVGVGDLSYSEEGEEGPEGLDFAPGAGFGDGFGGDDMADRGEYDEANMLYDDSDQDNRYLNVQEWSKEEGEDSDRDLNIELLTATLGQLKRVSQNTNSLNTFEKIEANLLPVLADLEKRLGAMANDENSSV